LNFWARTAPDSRSFTEKLKTDCISLYNNTGPISKVSEKTASENAKNCRSRQPHCRLTSPPQGTSTNIRINLIPPETRVIGLHFLPLIVWVYLHSNFCGSLRKTHLICDRVQCISTVQRFKVDFGTNRKGVCNCLLVINTGSNSSYLALFLRYGDLLSENLLIFTHSHSGL